ncbi:MAG: ABC transporter permease [Chloroflexi bacterium]|nr:ABC transporter permease [Chloroflexota bacterium]
MEKSITKKHPVVRFLSQSFTVLWSDLRFLRRFWKRTLWTSLMTPLLYLLAFGVGIAGMVTMEEGGGSYLAFVIPGIIAITAISTAYNASGNKLSVDKIFYKSFDEVMMAPLSTDAVAFGKGMVGVLRGILACGLFIILGMLMTNDFVVNWPFFAALMLSLLAFSFMGVAVGVIAKTHQDMSTFSSMVIMPMTFLCGTLFDPNIAPQWLQVILYSLPLTHSSTAMRAAVASGDIMWWSLAYMLIFAIICYIIARWQIKKLDF